MAKLKSRHSNLIKKFKQFRLVQKVKLQTIIKILRGAEFVCSFNKINPQEGKHSSVVYWRGDYYRKYIDETHILNNYYNDIKTVEEMKKLAVVKEANKILECTIQKKIELKKA